MYMLRCPPGWVGLILAPNSKSPVGLLSYQILHITVIDCMCCSFWHYCEQTFLGNFVVQFCLFCNSLRYDVQIYMIILNSLDSTFQIESLIWLSKLCKIYCLVVAILLSNCIDFHHDLIESKILQLQKE